MLNMRMSAFNASRISSADLPTPAKMILEAGTPALRARNSSPPDTMSAPPPSFAINRRIARLELAFIAKATMWGIFLKALSYALKWRTSVAWL